MSCTTNSTKFGRKFQRKWRYRVSTILKNENNKYALIKLNKILQKNYVIKDGQHCEKDMQKKKSKRLASGSGTGFKHR